MANRIFFTGGSGFVGSNMIPILLGEGYTIKALARSEKSSHAVSSYGAEPVRGDITDYHSLEEALKDCDIVIHAAAHMDFWGPKETFVQVNVHGTNNMLKAAKRAGVKTFLYIGAASVINGQPILDYDESYTPPKPPQDYYSLTKLHAEQAVVEANRNDFKTLALRPPAIWGPNNHHYDEMLSRVREGKWMWIGGGNHHLSSIHIYNLTNAVKAALKNGKGGEIYFVTDGEKRPLKTLFTQIFQKLGLDPGEKSLPRPLVLTMAKIVQFLWKAIGIRSKPPIVPMMVYLMGTEFSVSDQKARREIGYQNAVSIDEGLESLG